MLKSELIKYKEQILDTKSQSFCGAKWYNATIFLNSGKTMSCHHNPYHEVSDTDVLANYKALHNTNEKKRHRSEMQRGQRSEECNYCWRIEDTGGISDRVHKSQMHTDQDLAIAYNSSADKDFNLQVLELHFDKVCQMACSYCHAGYSTTWAQDIRKHGPYQDVETDKRLHYKYERRIDQLFKPDQENLYVEAFYKWWDADLHKTLKELRILGGEPLLSPHIWKFIQWFKSKETNCRLDIVSNLGPRIDVPKFLEAIDGKEVVIMTSMETVGEHAEYIRDGVDYDLWCRNVEKCLASDSVESIKVLSTVNALSLFRMPELLKQIDNWQTIYGNDSIEISVNILRYPVFQNITVLPKELRNNLVDRLEPWLDNLQVSRLIEYCRVVDEPDNIEQIRKDFKSFFTQYDKRRGKSFKETFPKLADWYGDI